MTEKLSSKRAKSKASPTPFVMAGYAVIFLTFGVLGVWAATARLDKAVIANGVIDVSTNRKEIQHLEGGVIERIAVKEGDVVRSGDILVKLNDVSAKANVDVVTSRLNIARAVVARLQSEREMREDVVFPADLLSDDVSAEVRATVADQRSIFQDRVSVLKSQLDILQSRIDQLKEEGRGLEKQKEAYLSRATMLDERIQRLKKGVTSGSVAKNLFAEVEDRYVDLQSNVARMETERAKTEDSIGESKYQMLQAEQQYRERASTEYKDANGQVQELAKQLSVYKDVLVRTEVKAPVDGVVQNIRFHTLGGVVRPGDVMMEIVPSNDVMLINAQVSPMDVDNIRAGLEAEIKFPSFHNRNMPIIFGKVETISKGSITPANTNASPYFLARVSVSKQNLPAGMQERLSAGMPAEVVISTGERTVANYIYSPLIDAVTKSMREE